MCRTVQLSSKISYLSAPNRYFLLNGNDSHFQEGNGGWGASYKRLNYIPKISRQKFLAQTQAGGRPRSRVRLHAFRRRRSLLGFASVHKIPFQPAVSNSDPPHFGCCFK